MQEILSASLTFTLVYSVPRNVGTEQDTRKKAKMYTHEVSIFPTYNRYKAVTDRQEKTTFIYCHWQGKVTELLWRQYGSRCPKPLKSSPLTLQCHIRECIPQRQSRVKSFIQKCPSHSPLFTTVET